MPSRVLQPLILLLFPLLTVAAPATRPAGDVDLENPAYWLARAMVEWPQISDPMAKPWPSLAEVQAATGDREGLKRTVAEFAAAQAQDSQFVVRHYSAIVPIFAHIGDEEGLRRAIKAAATPGPGESDATAQNRRLNMTRQLRDVGRYEQALALIEATKDVLDRHRALLDLAVAASRAGQADVTTRAFTLAEEATARARAEKHVNAHVASMETARAYLTLGHTEKAITLVRDKGTDREVTEIIGEAARVCAEADRTKESHKYAAEATARLANGSWGDRMSIAPRVAHGVARANHQPSVDSLIKQANAAKGVPVGPTNFQDGLAPLPPAQGFAQACYQGLASGAASRRDAAAARRYLANQVEIGRRERRLSKGLPTPAWGALPVAEALIRAGKASDAVELLTVGPFAAPSAERLHRSKHSEDKHLKHRVGETLALAGDFERAAQYYDATDGPPPIFTMERVRYGQLRPLLMAIEQLTTPERRCWEFLTAARELAAK